jgi:hypothetical protein
VAGEKLKFSMLTLSVEEGVLEFDELLLEFILLISFEELAGGVVVLPVFLSFLWPAATPTIIAITTITSAIGKNFLIQLSSLKNSYL